MKNKINLLTASVFLLCSNVLYCNSVNQKITDRNFKMFFSCGSENFENIPASSSSFETNSWVNNNITSSRLIKSLELEIWNFILKIFFTSRIGKMYNSVASTFIIFSLCRPTPSQKSPTLICSFYLRDILTPQNL